MIAAADTSARRLVRIRHVERKDQVGAVMELSSDPEYKALAVLVGRLDDEIVCRQRLGDESPGVAAKPTGADVFTQRYVAAWKLLGLSSVKYSYRWTLKCCPSSGFAFLTIGASDSTQAVRARAAEPSTASAVLGRSRDRPRMSCSSCSGTKNSNGSKAVRLNVPEISGRQ